MSLKLDDVLKTDFFKAAIQYTCGRSIEVIERTASFVIKSKNETGNKVSRILLLPPRGYTANAPNQTNSHDEAQKATIEVLGSIKENKAGFSKLKDCLLTVAFKDKSGVSNLNVPYLTFDIHNTPNLSVEFHSAGEAPFTVVKTNGYGFYHNLINNTDEWLALSLRKTLRPSKKVNLNPHLSQLPREAAETLNNLYECIQLYGDEIFERKPSLVSDVTSIKPEQSLPALGELLYTYDSGRHEACSVFAMILKIGKQYPKETKEFLVESMKNETVPSYYAEQLITKIDRQFPPQLSI